MVEAGKKYKAVKQNFKTLEETAFIVTVNWVEDRGDYWYIGYEPDEKRICQFGACKVRKEGRYKVINWRFEEVEK